MDRGGGGEVAEELGCEDGTEDGHDGVDAGEGALERTLFVGGDAAGDHGLEARSRDAAKAGDDDDGVDHPTVRGDAVEEVGEGHDAQAGNEAASFAPTADDAAREPALDDGEDKPHEGQGEAEFEFGPPEAVGDVEDPGAGEGVVGEAVQGEDAGEAEDNGVAA